MLPLPPEGGSFRAYFSMKAIPAGVIRVMAAGPAGAAAAVVATT